MNKQNLIERVRAAMVDRRVAIVALKTGLAEATIRRLIAGVGNPDISTVNLLADYLGVDRD